MTVVVPTLQDQRFEPIELAGSGSVATVWRALDRETGATVAIKLMRQSSMQLEAVQRLAQEVKILKTLSHPCVVKVFATGVEQTEGTPYLVMEWIDGISLRERIHQGGLSMLDVADIIGQICAGLTAAHDAGVVHRDLKPENVMLCAPEHIAVKIVDFGMAKVLGPAGPDLTQGEKIFGTPQYMSPERARGRQVGAPADVYAVGVMTYELLTGTRPFEADKPLDILIQHVSKQPPGLPDALAKVEPTVLTALAKEPKNRPSAAEFARLLAVSLTTLGEA